MQKALGIHHVGFGVKDLKKTRKFYEETLEFRGMLEEWEYSINSMADTFRNSPHNFEGWMPFQEAGGIIIEPILMKWPTPRPIHVNPQYGDIGVNKLTIAVPDVAKFCKTYNKKIQFCGKPKKVKLPGLGDYEFVYGKDPDGNLLEFATWDGVKVEKGTFGGAQILGVSVTDLERSKAFYKKHCDFDVVVSEHDAFSGKVGEVSGSKGTKVKSCLLDCSKREAGEGGMLELYEVSKPRGRSIPFGTQWGDFGYMEVTLISMANIHDLHNYYIEQGLDVVQRPTNFGTDEEGTVEYWFIYVRDPDGIFVETVVVRPLQ